MPITDGSQSPEDDPCRLRVRVLPIRDQSRASGIFSHGDQAIALCGFAGHSVARGRYVLVNVLTVSCGPSADGPGSHLAEEPPCAV